MDKDTKLLLGLILGEIYRTQKAIKPEMVRASDGTIFGLLNGVESVVTSHIDTLRGISDDDVKAVADVLEPYWREPERRAELNGYYDVEPEFERRGLDRGQVAVILKYLYSQGKFTEEIARFDSNHSPTEMRNLTRVDVD